MTLRLGVLVSGRGTNLQALIDAIDEGEIDAEIVIVICNRTGARAIERAHAASIPVQVVTRDLFDSRADQQQAICDLLRSAEVDLVVLAGFDQILLPAFVRAFEGRIINVHPSLLPAFAMTLHAQEEALAYGVKVSGCTVHFVTDDVDAGPIILQHPVEVREEDSPETLAARILPHEHRLLCRAVQLIAEGRVLIQGRRVFFAASKSV